MNDVLLKGGEIVVDKNELLYVVDAYDVPVAPYTRQETHERGLWHRAAHVWITNTQGQILCQKRTSNREQGAGRWEPCVGGHINWQMDYFSGAIKEVKEETGLEVEKDQLRLLKIYQDHQWKEFRGVFYLKTDCRLEDIRSEEDEVEAVKWVDIADVSGKMTGEQGDRWIRMGYEHEMLSILMRE